MSQRKNFRALNFFSFLNLGKTDSRRMSYYHQAINCQSQLSWKPVNRVLFLLWPYSTGQRGYRGPQRGLSGGITGRGWQGLLTPEKETGPLICTSDHNRGDIFGDGHWLIMASPLLSTFFFLSGSRGPPIGQSWGVGD